MLWDLKGGEGAGVIHQHTSAYAICQHTSADLKSGEGVGVIHGEHIVSTLAKLKDNAVFIALVNQLEVLHRRYRYPPL